MAPKVLLATTYRWFATARTAMAFANLGCKVDIVSPPNHPACSTRAVSRNYRFHGLAPERSIRAAILSSKPDIVIPSDDVAMRHLHRIYAAASRIQDSSFDAIRRALQASMGDPASYPVTESRDKFIALVREEGIRIPETKTVASADEVEHWVIDHGFPAVLKADGTSGGEGVKIVHSVPEALEAYRTLHAPLASMIVAKRTFIDGDSNCVLPWFMQRPREVSIQSFVDGADTNIAAACWQGEVLASIDVEVLETWKPKGPATIIRLQQNREREEAVRKIVRRLKYSGLCGFDFMVDAKTSNSYLIEMNARATQTCSLPLGPGHDLIASLCTALTGQPFSLPSIQLAGDTIALFPLAWQGDTSSKLFQSSYFDVPVDEPELIRLGLKQLDTSSQEKWISLFSRLGLYRP